MPRHGGPAVTGTVDGIDFDARYAVASMPGVAFWLHGWATEEVPERWELACEDADCLHDTGACWIYSEPELVPDLTRVRAVMAGDDREHIADVTDLTVITDEDYCGGCGQIGCGANVIPAT